MIHRQMTIEEVFSSYPSKSQRLAHEMTTAGLHCASCSAAVWETLEAGMLGHGFNDEQIDDLIEKLNTILNEKDELDTITVTEKAAEKFKTIQKDQKKEKLALRFGYTAGGCGGFEYILDFSEKAEADDQVFVSHGIEIHVKKAFVERLLGSAIDYAEGLMNGGFKVTNPNVKHSCSCGHSHSY